jgi:hypothetical protein
MNAFIKSSKQNESVHDNDSLTVSLLSYKGSQEVQSPNRKGQILVKAS